MRLTTHPTRQPASRRAVRVAAAVAALAAVLLGTSGCDSQDITRARLQAALGPTYKNLYTLQQKLQHGDYATTPPVASTATCAKGGKTATAGGSGNDWSCNVQWLAPTGALVAITYDVDVRPNGCYTAQGPSALVGQATIRGWDWANHTNPLYEFDGCFDTTS